MLNSRNARITFSVLLIVVNITAAGCAPPTAAPTETAAPPTATSTAAPTETDIPTATNTPFVPKATFKIAAEAPAGTDIATGARLAVQQLKLELRDLGYEVEFHEYDDRDQVDAAVTRANEIIADPGVLCVVGPYTSRVFSNVMDLYHVAGLAFISPSASNPSITERRYLEANRLSASDDGVGIAAARFLQSQGQTRVFIVRNENDFAGRGADAFKREAAVLGLTVVKEMTASIEMGNYAAVVEQVLEAEAEAVYFSGLGYQAGEFFRQARLAGFQGALMATDPDAALGAAAGPLAIEGDGTYYVSLAVPPGVLPSTAQFGRDFEATFKRPPGWFAAEAYDAAGVCLEAIQQATIAKGGELPTRQEVAQAVRALSEYSGITGNIRFDQVGGRTPAPYFIIQIKSIDPNLWLLNPIAEIIELPSQ